MIGQLAEITQGSALCDIWTVFKALSKNGLAEKSISAKGGKKCKQRCTLASFVAKYGLKLTDLVVIGGSRKSYCFSKLKRYY